MNQTPNSLFINMRAIHLSHLLYKGNFVSGVVENLTSPTCYKYFQYSLRKAARCNTTQIRKYSLNVSGSSFTPIRTSENVILYSNNNLKFLRVVNVFGLTFTAFWAVTSYQFATMRIVPESERLNLSILPWFARFDLISTTTRKIMAATFTALLGVGVFCGAWMYSVRSVGQVILGKGGKSVTFFTYNPLTFRMSNKIYADINEVSCQGHRSVSDVLPIKVKGRWMHFLLGKDGTYHNGPLFDKTVGLKRNI